MGGVAYCRTSIAALRAVALEQTRLAARHHGMRPTLLLRGMVNAAPWPGSCVAKPNGNRGAASNIQLLLQRGRGKCCASFHSAQPTELQYLMACGQPWS